jgi:GT2 family glycosyltransferase
MLQERAVVPPSLKFPKVGVVILNWNNYRDTARCLDSFGSVTYANYLIYVVDNGSIDDSALRLGENFKNDYIRFILNPENLGFASGCNKGIAQALADGCEYLLLLNNDCIICDPGFLDKAVEFAESRPECGIEGGKILFWPETDRIWSTGGYVKALGAEKYIGYSELDVGQYEVVSEREFISGAFMLIKREVARTIGLLPEAYFFGKEDLEYPVRAARAGFKVLYNPEVTIYHEASHSHSITDPTYVYNGALSHILFRKRNYGRVYFRFWFLLYALYLRFLFSIKFRVQRSRYLKGIEPSVIRGAMLCALEDSKGTSAISGAMLEAFRSQFVGKKKAT